MWRWKQPIERRLAAILAADVAEYSRQVVRHQTPRRPGANDPAQSVEHLAQRPTPLRRIFRQQAQLQRDKRPFLLAHVTRAGLACGLHSHNLSTPALPDGL
jgi:hypothetical protein